MDCSRLWSGDFVQSFNTSVPKNWIFQTLFSCVGLYRVNTARGDCGKPQEGGFGESE